MRNFIFRPLCVATVVLFLGACSGDDPVVPPGEEAVTDVYTPGSVFTPFTAEIAVGGTVRFHMQRAPDGDGHNAIFSRVAPGAPEDINIVADTVVTRAFNTRGTFGYICTVHPGMVGEVLVY
jgi:plastocyanin